MFKTARLYLQLTIRTTMSGFKNYKIYSIQESLNICYINRW